jgi:hypothetical protein
VTDANPDGSPAGTPASPPPPGYPGAETPYPPAPTPPAYGSQPGYGAPAQAQAPYGAPAYPQQPYGYGPGYGYGPKQNTLAIVSLIAGIAAFVILPLIASIVAVITGHMSLKQLKTSGEGGRGMALTGTILGWVGIGLAAIGIVLLILWIIFIVGVASSTSSYDYS